MFGLDGCRCGRRPELSQAQAIGRISPPARSLPKPKLQCPQPCHGASCPLRATWRGLCCTAFENPRGLRLHAIKTGRNFQLRYLCRQVAIEASSRRLLDRWVISRMNDEVKLISSGRDRSCFAANSDRSETSGMFRIFVTLCLLVGAAPALAGETLRIGLQKTGTFAWQLDVIRRHGLASGAGLDLKISEYASPGRGQACPQQRLGRSRRRRLALGCSCPRAWRQIAVLSLFQFGRLHHGEARFTAAEDRRPQGQGSRRRGRPARQELAHRPGGRDAPGHRSQARSRPRVRRPAADFSEIAAGRSRSEPQFLEFLRQAGGAGLSPPPRRARCAGGARAERNRSLSSATRFPRISRPVTRARSTASSRLRKRPTTSCCDPTRNGMRCAR